MTGRKLAEEVAELFWLFDCLLRGQAIAGPARDRWLRPAFATAQLARHGVGLLLARRQVDADRCGHRNIHRGHAYLRPEIGLLGLVELLVFLGVARFRVDQGMVRDPPGRPCASLSRDLQPHGRVDRVLAGKRRCNLVRGGCLVVLGQVLLDRHLRDQEPDFCCRPLHAVDGRPGPATFDQRRGETSSAFSPSDCASWTCSSYCCSAELSKLDTYAGLSAHASRYWFNWAWVIVWPLTIAAGDDVLQLVEGAAEQPSQGDRSNRLGARAHAGACDKGGKECGVSQPAQC